MNHPSLPFALLVLFLTRFTVGAEDLASPQNQKWTRMEPDVSNVRPGDSFVWAERAPVTEKHQCVFYLMGKNQAKLEEIVQQVSDPKSPSYGKYLTKAQLDELTVDKEGTQAVLKFIKDTGATVLDQNASSIKTEAPISTWEAAFNTVFYIVTNPKDPKQRLLRAHEYSLPSNISPFVRFVGGTVQMPVKIHGGPVRIEKLPVEIGK